jgi:hypothetical protein
MVRPLVLLLVLLPATCCGRKSHFQEGDEVPLYANKVGPYVNPSETYNYYDLPFCRSAGTDEKGSHGDVRQSLGETLKGDEQTTTPFDVRFRKDVAMAQLCQMQYDRAQVKKLEVAIDDDYYFEFVFDKLPIWGFIGEQKLVNATRRSYLFTHLHFQFKYHGDQVVEASASTNATLEAELREDGGPVSFTYSITWTETDTTYGHRMDKYDRSSFMPMHLQIHWFSIVNSIVTVLLLTGFMATIMMRVLKNDFVKYEKDVEADDADESGWKMIHGDVRPAELECHSGVIRCAARRIACVENLTPAAAV